MSEILFARLDEVATLSLTGTSGHVVPFLDGNNTWTGRNTFANTVNIATNTTSGVFPNTNLTINQNTVTLPSWVNGANEKWAVQVGGANASPVVVGVDSFGTGNFTAFSVFDLRRANGTAAAPTPLKSGDLIGVIGGLGRVEAIPSVTTTGYSGGLVQIRYYADQDLSATANGGSIAFLTTLNNTVANTSVQERVRIANTGFVGIGSNNPQSLLHLNQNTTQNIAAESGTVSQISGADSTNAYFQIDTFGAALNQFGIIFFRQAAGTAAAKTGVQSGAVLGVIGAEAYTSAGAYTNKNSQITFVTTEIQTATAQGQAVTFVTTPNTTTVATEAGRFTASGGLAVGLTTNTTFGVINALTGFRINSVATSGNVLRGNGTNFVSATLAATDLSGLGTGVATALGTNVGSAGAFVTFNGAGGTPSSIILTNATGTASSLTAGNAATVTTNANLTGVITSSGNATSIASQTGTGTKFVVDASPTLTGTPLTTTAAVDTNTTQIASTAFVIAQAASATPLINGTATVGTSTRFARADHIHPTDTTLAPKASPTFTGTVIIPTPFTLGAISVTSTGTQLNYLNAATGTTGTTSTNLVFSTSPLLVTPTIGVATATSINKVAITAPATSATITIADGTILTETTSTSIGKGQYLGTATNDAATAGNIGELISSTIAFGSAVSITSTISANITSISVPAGEWRIAANVHYIGGAATTITQINTSISLTSATADATADRFGQFYGNGYALVGGIISVGVPQNPRFSFASTTTVYLVTSSVFASTLSGYGYIGATRVR